jgi:hypothetical protein
LYFIALFAKSSKTKALIKLEISKKITNKKDKKSSKKIIIFCTYLYLYSIIVKHSDVKKPRGTGL